MTGLFRKDLALLSCSRKGLIFLPFIAVMMVLVMDFDATFIVFYMTFLGSFFVNNTITYDDFDNGMAYLMTLPADRKTYVREKYLFGFSIGGIFWLASVVLGTVINFNCRTLDWLEWLACCGCAVFFLGIILAFIVPIQLKFGSDNGRVAIFILAFVIAGICYLISFLGEKLGVNWNQAAAPFMTLHPAVIFGLAAIAALICLLISQAFSMRIMNSKEF